MNADSIYCPIPQAHALFPSFYLVIIPGNPPDSFYLPTPEKFKCRLPLAITGWSSFYGSAGK